MHIPKIRYTIPVVNLQELACRKKQLSDLKPLRALTNLQKRNCHNNQISDLEPLRALTKWQALTINLNKINNLKTIHALTKAASGKNCGFIHFHI
jgi:internalin A